jgi:Fe-Mn family superoxide dismutase
MYKLPELPFPKDAFQGVISEECFEYHHGKHHKNYVDKLNHLIKGTEWENKSLDEIVMK